MTPAGKRLWNKGAGGQLEVVNSLFALMQDAPMTDGHLAIDTSRRCGACIPARHLVNAVDVVPARDGERLDLPWAAHPLIGYERGRRQIRAFEACAPQGPGIPSSPKTITSRSERDFLLPPLGRVRV